MNKVVLSVYSTFKGRSDSAACRPWSSPKQSKTPLVRCHRRKSMGPLRPWAGGADKRAEGQAVKRPRCCMATNRGDSTSIQVRKSRVMNSRSMAGGPQIAAPSAR